MELDIDRVSVWLRSNSSNLPFCDIQITSSDGDVSFVSSVSNESSEEEDEEEDEEEEESVLSPNTITESFQRIPRFCEFKDEEGTEISFTLNEVDGITLDEYCDGELTIASVRVLRIDETNCTIHDGQEEIPVPSDEFPRVMSWLRSVCADAHVSIERIDSVVVEEETKGESFMVDDGEEEKDDGVEEKDDEIDVVVKKVEKKKKGAKNTEEEIVKKVEKKKPKEKAVMKTKKAVKEVKKSKNKTVKKVEKIKKRAVETKNTNQERRKRKKKKMSSTNCVVSSFDFHVESGIRLDLNGENGSLELWQGYEQLMECVEEIHMDEEIC